MVFCFVNEIDTKGPRSVKRNRIKSMELVIAVFSPGSFTHKYKY